MSGDVRQDRDQNIDRKIDEERIVVCSADALGENQTVKFRITRGPGEGFVIRHNGELYAYRNECRHIPLTMDWVENRFLSRDGCWIQCATHGARYEIATGLCVAGPPAGLVLHRLPVTVEDGTIIVRVAAGEVDPRR
ncbi:MAG TPA: Rieske 2Fe-2S domain-containing protein [Candidatus Limnocylindrales bacterium]|nr:Rieske 2Fe-2S domain-containing protein [Candidatus Limnocylindrales bacterium]